MRVRFLKHAVAAEVVYEPGDLAELPDDLAAYYLAERSADQASDSDSPDGDGKTKAPAGNRSKPSR